jgi:hypothetical protein
MSERPSCAPIQRLGRERRAYTCIRIHANPGCFYVLRTRLVDARAFGAAQRNVEGSVM